MRLKIVSVIFVFLPYVVFAYQNPGTPTGFVNDFADLLTVEEENGLELKIRDFEKKTSNELSVVTISSLEGDTIENFAVKLFEDWKIGKEGKDNGILLLVASDDRQMRIEVGYGLEGALTDAQSYWIIQNSLKPFFQKGDFYGGITDGVDSIVSITKGEFSPDTSLKNDNGFNFNGDTFFFLIWVAWIFLVWIGSILARSKSWWGGGIVGGIVAVIIALVLTFISGLVSALILIPLGLWFDYVISKKYKTIKETGQTLPWWMGGRGGGGFSGGGFGGFGGGRSGGGGSSGGW